MDKINIAFFGSSEFSIPTLKYLFQEENFNISAIITMPPAEKNRGKKLSNNVVHDFAVQNNFDEKLIFTPKTLKNSEILEKLKLLSLDFIVVVAYGKIIPKALIEIPKYEILNLHPSMLPKYRGAAPIERAIENGDESIDICIMKVDVGLDTGDVFTRVRYILNENKFADEIIPDVAEIGAKLMIDSIKTIAEGRKNTFEKQTEKGMVYANKIDKSELFIDLNNSNLEARQVYNKIRAFNNSGCCYFIIDGLRVKIIRAEFMDKNHNNKYGFDKQSGWLFLKNGVIIPTILQKEGKKAMDLKSFLNGYKK